MMVYLTECGKSREKQVGRKRVLRANKKFCLWIRLVRDAK